MAHGKRRLLGYVTKQDVTQRDITMWDVTKRDVTKRDVTKRDVTERRRVSAVWSPIGRGPSGPGGG